jgi:isopentenyl phosphate kinase
MLSGTCGTPSVNTIRILLIAVPRLFGDVLRRTSADDMVVVGDQAGPDDLVAIVDSLSADVVVFGSSAGVLPRSFETLLERRPAIRVIVVSTDARRTTLYLLDVTPRGLVALVRAAATAW